MSSAKRPYKETMSSSSSISNTTTASVNDDFVKLQIEQDIQDMDIEQNINPKELIEGNFRRKKPNNDKDDDDLLESNTFISNPFPSFLNDISFQPFQLSSTLSPRASDTTISSTSRFHKQSPIDLLTPSSTISISTPETNQTRDSDITYVTTNVNPFNNPSNEYFSPPIDFTVEYIRTELRESDSKGPFSSFYPQIYNNNGLVVYEEPFNYLIQLFEFCNNSSTKLASNVTSVLTGLVTLLNVQLDGFDIPFIEHHKWNGSNFYGSIDVATLLDHLDEGLGISSTEYVFYDRADNGSSFIRTGRSVLNCDFRKTYGKPKSTANTPSPQTLLDNNELRHAVLDADAERETQLFLEFLAEDDQDNDIDHADENPGTGFDSTTTAVRCISKPSAGGMDSETDDDLIHSEESAFEEIDDVSDIESVLTDSTIEEDWHSVSRHNSK
ncbi:8301_t:CDS:2 [Funneliformis mosseae]|uniref:8301_t:CDS:1 n=1 Tax=Funneliformis mosseae TaxID=27381 RepID=A0A9N9FBW8_FUNMO|nr:8301_t:CDS:2 [Funneliformis mosseae]